MMKKRIIKIYNINPIGYKPTSIQVKEIESGIFACRFLDVNVINEFNSTGFKVSYKSNAESFLLNGMLPLEYTVNVWKEYLKKNNNPDIEFSIDNF
jgi:hypothetical protein